jgi:hypothetical protein
VVGGTRCVLEVYVSLPPPVASALGVSVGREEVEGVSEAEGRCGVVLDLDLEELELAAAVWGERSLVSCAERCYGAGRRGLAIMIEKHDKGRGRGEMEEHAGIQ